MKKLSNRVTCYAEAEAMFKNRRKRKLARNTVLVNTVQGYGIKLYNTVIVEYLDANRIRLNTGGWRTRTTFSRIKDFTAFSISEVGFTRYTMPDNVVIDTRDLFIEYPKSKVANTFTYKTIKNIASELKTVKIQHIEQSRLSGECWSVQFSGLVACKGCEFKNTEECGGQRILETGENKQGVRITQNKGV